MPEQSEGDPNALTEITEEEEEKEGEVFYQF